MSRIERWRESEKGVIMSLEGANTSMLDVKYWGRRRKTGTPPTVSPPPPPRQGTEPSVGTQVGALNSQGIQALSGLTGVQNS